MPSPNRPARLNRSLLAVTGLLLLAGAATLLSIGCGLLPTLNPHTSLLPTRLVLPGWAAWVAAVLAVLVGLACLRWMAAQTLRRPKTGTWTLTSDPTHGTTRMTADTAAAPLTAEIETYPGVHTSSAHLTGPRTQPVLHLVIATEERADIAALRDRIDTEALPRLRQALDLEHLNADLLLRLNHTRRSRIGR